MQQSNSYRGLSLHKLSWQLRLLQSREGKEKKAVTQLAGSRSQSQTQKGQNEAGNKHEAATNGSDKLTVKPASDNFQDTAKKQKDKEAKKSNEHQRAKYEAQIHALENEIKNIDENMEIYASDYVKLNQLYQQKEELSRRLEAIMEERISLS